jgi:hypothetical protein
LSVSGHRHELGRGVRPAVLLTAGHKDLALLVVRTRRAALPRLGCTGHWL